jgi:hypothetical protein
MKARLVEANCRAHRPDRGRRDRCGWRQPLHYLRTLAPDRGRRRIHVSRPGEWRPTRSPACRNGATGVTRQRCRRRWRRCARRRGKRRQHHAAVDRRRQGRRHHRRMGRGGSRGVRRIPRTDRRGARPSNRTGGLDEIRAEVDAVSARLGRRLKFLVGKPGLDGHSNGAEQIAARARDWAWISIYAGIRLTPAEIVNAAREDSAPMCSACRSCLGRTCR